MSERMFRSPFDNQNRLTPQIITVSAVFAVGIGALVLLGILVVLSWKEERLSAELAIAILAGAFLATMGVAVYLTAMAARRRDRRQLLAEERFRNAIDASPAGMFMVDAAGTIVLASRQAEEVLGYHPNELVGRPVEMLVPPAQQLRHRAEREAFQAAPAPRRMGAGRDLFALRKDGRRVPVEIGLRPLVQDNQRMVLASIIDITERKAQEVELKRSNEELERFAYIASHDLKEPLRMVNGYLQLLSKRYGKQLDDDARTFIGYAVDGAERMSGLIDDLLEYSRVNSRGNVVEPVDANRIVQEAMKNLEVTIKEAGAVIRVDPLPTIHADARHLARVFQNLLGNALKFRGTAAPHIAVSAKPFEDGWQFSVQDNGIGIDPKQFSRLFVIFSRLHSRTEYPGTGIGLAISKKIVELHGGRMWVESTPGQGSTFHFTVSQAAAPRDLPNGLPSHRPGAPERRPFQRCIDGPLGL